MGTVIGLVGVAWVVWGVGILKLAVGGIHEVYGAIVLSFGVLFLGFAVLLNKVDTLLAVSTAAAKGEKP